MNVREITEIILAQNGNIKIENTCDQLIEGSWENQVTGVVTTFMATVEVIRRAIEKRCNLIITHEPTYFTGAGNLDWVKEDPVYKMKTALIRNNGISIWRYHDHTHFIQPDLIYAGLLKDLGWKNYLENKLAFPYCYAIPYTSVIDLVNLLKKTLGMKVIRVVGDTNMECRRIGILVGFLSLGLGVEEMPAKLMREQQLDVIICGEITEFNLSAYVRDAAALGLKKAIIIIGHERSESPGMKDIAGWLQPLLKGIPVHYIETGEPFRYY